MACATACAVPVISILGIELATPSWGGRHQAVSRSPASAACYQAIAQHDYPNIQGILFVSTLVVLIVGFIADVTQRLVDPRLRHRARSSASTLRQPDWSAEADQLEPPPLNDGPEAPLPRPLRGHAPGRDDRPHRARVAGAWLPYDLKATRSGSRLEAQG
jgi:hypothetical protein